MLTIEGTYKNGQIVLSELPAQFDEAQVLVTFLEPSHIDLRTRGINQEQAAELRARFGAIAEDWNQPEMDVYDNH